MLYIAALTLLSVFSYGDAAITPVEIDSSMLRQTLPGCPAICCKKYCPAGSVATCTGTKPNYTCAPATSVAPSCFNSAAPGCLATQCTPRTNCNRACATLIDFDLSIVFCPN